jgi:hypothetical protein
VQRIRGAGLVIVVALAFVAGGLRAQGAAPVDTLRWRLIGVSSDGTQYYLDLETIRTTGNARAGDTVTVWTLRHHELAIEFAGDSVTDYKELFRFDCSGLRLQPVSFLVYDGSKLVESDTDEGQWKPITPESEGEEFATWACRIGPRLRNAKRVPSATAPDTSRRL